MVYRSICPRQTHLKALVRLGDRWAFFRKDERLPRVIALTKAHPSTPRPLNASVFLLLKELQAVVPRTRWRLERKLDVVANASTVCLRVAVIRSKERERMAKVALLRREHARQSIVIPGHKQR